MTRLLTSASTGSVRMRGVLARAILSLTTALLAGGMVAHAAPSAAAQRTAGQAAVLPMATPLGMVDATGLPAGQAMVVALRVHVPARTHFTHLHGGNVYNVVLSGSLQSVDDGVTHTYHAGQFFWEPLGHVHTLATTQPADFYSLTFLTPQAAPVLPVQGETTPPPPVTVLSSFAATGLPTGAAKVVALRVSVPEGVNFKHVHGGNVYNVMLSGVVQSIDDGVTHTYHAGQFFWEPVGHVHTLIGVKPAVFYSLQFLTAHAAPVQPVQ